MTDSRTRSLHRGRRLAANLATSIDQAHAAAHDLRERLADACALALRLDRDPGLTRDLHRDYLLAGQLVVMLGNLGREAHDLRRNAVFDLDAAAGGDTADLVRSRVASLSYGLGRLRGSAHALGPALDADRTHARRLAPILDTALDRARARGLALDVDPTPGFARDVAGSAADAQWLCHRLVDWSASADLLPATAVQRRQARTAGRLTAVAVRVLPVQHRARYREEYLAELYDLAAMGVPRWGQLVYSLRLLDRAWMVRAELRTPWASRVKS